MRDVGVAASKPKNGALQHSKDQPDFKVFATMTLRTTNLMRHFNKSFQSFFQFRSIFSKSVLPSLAIGIHLLLFSTVSAQQTVMKQNPAEPEKASSIYEFVAKDIDGNDVDFETYKGQVLVVVNVASKCGYTSKHIDELNELHTKYHDKGLRILGFPCNQFGSQEPGTCPIIKDFAKKRNVQYELFEKVDVNGQSAHPIFKYLKAKQGGLLIDAIKWNFTKFIVDRNGIPVERFAATTSPLNMNIEKYL